MSERTELRAHCAFGSGSGAARRASPRPPRAKIVVMLAQIEAQLRLRNLQPVAVVYESWPLPRASDCGAGAAAWARITVLAEPGEFNGPLVRWCEWQHTQFGWADGPFPTLDLSPSAALPASVQP